MPARPNVRDKVTKYLYSSTCAHALKTTCTSNVTTAAFIDSDLLFDYKDNSRVQARMNIDS